MKLPRGATWLRRDIRYLHGDGYFTNRSDAQKFPPPGVLGGLTGLPSRHGLIRADGTPTAWPSKITNMTIAAGDLIRMETAGGGGYGPPTERDPEAVLGDVLGGKVSAAEARDVYRVMVNRERGAVDRAATAALRAERRP